jgi:peptide/nickel transport system substrate-binding protein
MAEATRDQNKILEYVQKAEEIFVEDAPIWFFNYNKAVLAKQPWVNGLAPVAPEMMFQDMTNVWVDETSPRANMK